MNFFKSLALHYDTKMIDLKCLLILLLFFLLKVCAFTCKHLMLFKKQFVTSRHDNDPKYLFSLWFNMEMGIFVHEYIKKKAI